MKLKNQFDLPLSIAVWLANDTYQYSSNPSVISSTTILKPIKSLVLSRDPSVIDKQADLTALIPSRLGTAIHSAIEEAWMTGDIKTKLTNLGYPESMIEKVRINQEQVNEGDIPIYLEQRAFQKLGNWTISGQFDFVCNGILEDFKSTSTVTWTTQSNASKYIEQASIYRWLNPKIITEDYFYIRYIFTDWSAAKAKQNKEYPQSRIISQKYILLSLAETESLIRSKLAQLDKYLGSPQEEIPECTPEELWAKPTTYAYYKDPNKLVRSTKNFNSYFEAHKKWLEDGSVGVIQERPGEIVYCRYCPAANICDQAQDYMNRGLLIL